MTEKAKNLLAGFQVKRTPQSVLKITGAAARTRAATGNVPPAEVPGKGKQAAATETSKKRKHADPPPPPPKTQVVVDVSPSSGNAAEAATALWAPDLQYRDCAPDRKSVV